MTLFFAAMTAWPQPPRRVAQPQPATVQRGEPKIVYVAAFVSRNITNKDLLASFTDQYENLLIESRSLRVLDRLTFERILAEAKNEGYIASMNDLNARAKQQLAGVERADGVVFGEVTDDKESGEYIITVTLESFDSVKHWKRFVSMKRGIIGDRSSRHEALKGLVSGTQTYLTQSVVHRTTINGFLFDLNRCVRSDRQLTCELEVTNSSEDRELSLDLPGSRVVDQNSFAAQASAAVIAGQSRRAYRGISQTILSGRPTKMTIIFVGVSSEASVIGRLDLRLSESEHNTSFNVVLRNIQIEQ